MKKLYFILIGVVVGATAMGQQVENAKSRATLPMDPKPEEVTGEVAPHKSVPAKGTNPSRAVVWSEDFANGTNGNNTSVPPNWTTSSQPVPTLWSWADTNAAFPTAYTTMYTSSSPANGWMMFDAITNWLANHNNPADYAINTDGYLTSPAIDVSANPNVRLDFQHEFYHCCNFEFQPKIQVSSNSFISYAEFEFDGGDIPRNEYNIDASDPHASVDISTAFGSPYFVNPNAFNFRFVWDGTPADANGQKAVVYWWMIDDVEIIELEPYDMKGGDIIAYGTQAADGFSDPLYTQVPAAQTFPVTMLVEAENFGSESILDLSIATSVDGASSGNVFSGNIASDSLQYTEKDTFEVTTTWTPALGTSDTYAISAIVGNDSTAIYDQSDNNDCDTLFTMVNDSVWARDDGVFFDRRTAVHNGNNLNREYAIGNMIYFHESAIVSSISFWLSTLSGADNAPLAKVVLWEFDDNQTLWVPFEESDDFDVDTGMINGTWVTKSFKNPVVIDKDKEYAAMIFHYSQVDTVYTAMSGVDDWGRQSRLWTWDDDPAPAGQQMNMYFMGTIPMVRLNLAPADVSIEEIPELASFVANPNPFNDEINLKFSLPASNNVDISIVDISGKVVHTESFGNLPSGINRINIDTRDLNPGVYFVNAQSGKERVTEKVVKLQ